MSVKTFGLSSLLLEIITCFIACHSDEFSDIDSSSAFTHAQRILYNVSSLRYLSSLKNFSFVFSKKRLL